MNRLRGTTGTLLIAAMAMSGTTCSLLLDHSAVQCKTDDDCGLLGTYPSCQKGLCVPSSLQPPMCFLIKPPAHIPLLEPNFLNSCSVNAMLSVTNDATSSCLTFKTSFDDGGMIKPPPTPPTNLAKLPQTPTSLCKDLVTSDKSIIYISGSSNFAPLLQELSQVIVKSIGIVPVFRTTTSCTGVKSMNPASSTYASDHFIKDPIGSTAGSTDPFPTYAQIFLGDGNPAVNCLLGTPTPVDLGESEIAQDTCGPPVNSPDTVGESQGPILPIIFVVPKLSTQKVISSEAAQLVFGSGGGVPPWEPLDPTTMISDPFLYIRAAGTATLRLVGKQIGLLPNQFWGTDQGNAAAMASNLGLLTKPDEADAALGIIGSDFYDQPANRDRLKALGFQASGQSCAYLPDSSLTSRDKINVRDGHYPLWGRIHFFAQRMNNQLVSPTAKTFLDLLTAAVLDPEILSALIKAGFVPPCAMQVTRTSELGDFTYAVPPAVACGCAFDAQVGVNPLDPACTSCQSNADCPSNRSSCRYGYCERESS